MTEDGVQQAPVAMRDGWPDTYFAVIFTAQRTMSDENMYQITENRMVTLAQKQRGFLGIEAVRGDDGIGITVSYWLDREAIRNWRINLSILQPNKWAGRNFMIGTTSVSLR